MSELEIATVTLNAKEEVGTGNHSKDRSKKSWNCPFKAKLNSDEDFCEGTNHESTTGGVTSGGTLTSPMTLL